MDTKRCSKCRKVKPREEFNKCSGAKCGLRPECKECQSKDNRRYHEANRERLLEQKRVYTIKNPDKWRAYEAKRRAAKLQRTPAWANQAVIDDIYAEVEVIELLLGEPCHVDH